MIRPWARLSFLAAAGLIAFGATRAQEMPANVFYANFRDLTREARRLYKSQGATLWGRRIPPMRWMAVWKDDLLLTEDPGVPGFRRSEGIWIGPRPEAMMMANTAVRFADRDWAMVKVSGFAVQRAAALRLLIHEGWHSIQGVVLPGSSEGGGASPTDLLDRPEGRTWLRLEVDALATSLRSDGPPRAAALHDALLFRAARYAQASDQEQIWERELDINEGIAEYMAWRLTPQDAPRKALAERIREKVRDTPSFTRAFAYWTGPAYGLLLDDLAPSWRRALERTRPLDLALVAADLLFPGESGLRSCLAGAGPSPEERASVQGSAQTAAARYGLARVRAEEEARWARLERERGELAALFTKGPTLRLRPREMRIVFDPNAVVALEGLGTCYKESFSWRSQDGSLETESGVLVTPDWKELWVPLGAQELPPGTLHEPLTIAAPRFTLRLVSGWTFRREGNAVTAEPPPEAGRKTDAESN